MRYNVGAFYATDDSFQDSGIVCFLLHAVEF